MRHDRYTRRQREALEDAARDRRALASACEPVFRVAGVDFTNRMEECAYSGDDGIATTLEATIAARLPVEYEQKLCNVDWHVNGAVFGGFRGRVVSLTRQGRYTSLVAATAGYESERTVLGDSPSDDREYAGVRPDTALYDALALLPYDGMELGPFAAPLLYLTGSDAVSWTEYVSSVVDTVSEQGRLSVADTPLNVAYAYPLAPLSRREAPVWTLEEARDTDDIGLGTADGERYSRVLVYTTDADGVHQPVARAGVDNRGFVVPWRSALPVELTDGSTDSGYSLAYSTAMELGGNDLTVSVETAYPPFFLFRGDVFRAVSKEYLRDSTLVSTHLARCTSVSVDVVGRSGTVGGTATRTGVEELPTAPARFPASTGFVRPMWGVDSDAQPYLSTDLPWVVGMDERTVTVDTALAASLGVTLTDDGSGTVVIS